MITSLHCGINSVSIIIVLAPQSRNDGPTRNDLLSQLWLHSAVGNLELCTSITEVIVLLERCTGGIIMVKIFGVTTEYPAAIVLDLTACLFL